MNSDLRVSSLEQIWILRHCTGLKWLAAYFMSNQAEHRIPPRMRDLPRTDSIQSFGSDSCSPAGGHTLLDYTSPSRRDASEVQEYETAVAAANTMTVVKAEAGAREGRDVVGQGNGCNFFYW